MINDEDEDEGLSAVEITRAILGVAVGYILFASAGVLLFAVSLPHALEPHHLLFVAAAVAAGVAYSSLAGYVGVAMAGRAARESMIAFAVAIALGSVVLFALRPAGLAPWSQATVVLLFGPAALIGALSRCRQARDFLNVHHDRP